MLPLTLLVVLRLNFTFTIKLCRSVIEYNYWHSPITALFLCTAFNAAFSSLVRSRWGSSTKIKHLCFHILWIYTIKVKTRHEYIFSEANLFASPVPTKLYLKVVRSFTTLPSFENKSEVSSHRSVLPNFSAISYNRNILSSSSTRLPFFSPSSWQLQLYFPLEKLCCSSILPVSLAFIYQRTVTKIVATPPQSIMM